MRGYIKRIFKKKHPILLLLAIAALLLFVLIHFIASLFVKRSAEEWEQFIEQCQESTQSALRKTEQANVLRQEIAAQSEALRGQLASLDGTRCMKYDLLGEERQMALLAFVNNTYALAELLNKGMGEK